MASKTIPADLTRVVGVTNIKSTPIAADKLTYFVGITLNNTESQTLESRRSTQHEAYAELTGTYGFSEISSLTFTAGYRLTTSTEETQSSSTASSKEVTNNLQVEIDFGEIAPGKGLYVYQPTLTTDKILLNFRDLIVADEPLKDFRAQITIEGEVDDGVRLCALECFTDENAAHVLCYDGGDNIRMYDSWVVADGNRQAAARWRIEPCTSLGNDTVKDVYWVIHEATGRLLTWPGEGRIYAGDPWVKAKPHEEGGASLWTVLPADVPERFYIYPFRNGEKMLAWYPEHEVYAGDAKASKRPDAKPAVLWRLRTMSSVPPRAT